MVPLWTRGWAGWPHWPARYAGAPNVTPRHWQMPARVCAGAAHVPSPPPATCTGGQGDQRVVKSKPECCGVCRKQLGPEQGPWRGGCLHPSSVCPPAHVVLGGRDPGSPGSGLGPHPHGVRQPPRLSAGPTGWGSVGRPPPQCVCPWPSPCRAGLEAWRPSSLPWRRGFVPGRGPEGPCLLWGSGQPHVPGEAGFPHLPTPISCGASSPGPSPLHACRTLTPHLPSHVLDTGQVPRQSRRLGQGEGGAAQGAWCWPGGHVTRSLLEREGRPSPPQPVHREGLCCTVLSL